MSSNWKKAIALIAGLDLLIYLFLFHSGVVLPFINPSVTDYKAQITSFPRDYMQQLIWLLVHWPSSFIADQIAGDRLVALSILQWTLVLAIIGRLLSRKKKA
jgi:hypothetical protein